MGATLRSSVCIGNGWLGRAIGSTLSIRTVPRRQFCAAAVADQTVVYVASGRSAIPTSTGLGTALRSELAHLRHVLNACSAARVERVVVLGSSDVAGYTESITGASPQAPVTTYAKVKAALEDECVLRASAGEPVTVVRLAPVHGPGKKRTADLLSLARSPVVPLVAKGAHSVGFVLLDDALRALEHLGREDAPSVVTVGGGATPLHALLACLAEAQGSSPRWVNVPIPIGAWRRVSRIPGFPDSLHWLLRLSTPRAVEMEVPVPITPLAAAARRLVTAC